MAEDIAGEGGEAPQDSVKVTPPVQPREIDPYDNAPLQGTALCLSGGGYRAMLFHLGTLWRLNELGYLPKLDRISSVSGGSITAGVLGASWSRLEFDGKGVAEQFKALVVEPVRRMGAKTIDVSSVVRGILGFGSVGDKVANAYRKHLFGDATLQDLPDRPRFVINATNMQSGVLWRFSKPYTWDYRVGQIKNPRIKLAVAAAASAAFPPVLSPVVLNVSDADFTPNSGKDLQRSPFTTRVVLTDGGVYDNLGLETAWKSCRTILVSDAGGNRDTLAGLSVEVPPTVVIEAFEAMVCPMLEGIRAALLETATLAALRDTLLPKLISGELRVKDAEGMIGNMADASS